MALSFNLYAMTSQPTQKVAHGVKLGLCEMDGSEISVTKSHRSIAATVQFIDAIDTFNLSSEDKKCFYEQMLVIASIHPGANWDENHRQEKNTDWIH